MPCQRILGGRCFGQGRSSLAQRRRGPAGSEEKCVPSYPVETDVALDNNRDIVVAKGGGGNLPSDVQSNAHRAPQLGNY